MVSSSTFSRIVRRPRAPVLRCIAFCATAAQRVLAELELDAFHVEQLAVLLGERVLRLGQDRHQRRLVELVERRDDRQAADELRDQAVLDQVLRLDVVEQVAAVRPRVRSDARRR